MTKIDDQALVKNVPTRAANIVSDYREKVSATNGKALLSAKERKAHIATLQRQATAKLEKLRREGAAAQARLTAKPDVAATSTEEQTLSELRQQRTWNRIKGLLDAAARDQRGELPDPLDLIRDELAKQDTTITQVLRDELPSWLASNGLQPYQTALPSLFAASEPKDSSTVKLERSWKRVEVALAQAEGLVEAKNANEHEAKLTQGYDLAGYEDGSLVEIAAVPVATAEIDGFGRPQQTTALPALIESF